jgi:hypothetical protein
VVFYDSLHEAVAAAHEGAGGGSVDQPDEITLLADVVLDEPLIVTDGVHIRLVAGGADRTIRRGGSSPNSGGNIEFPVIWVKGENSSISLGSPSGMDADILSVELIIDGGYLNVPPVQAHAPLAAVSGPGSKLIMYDGAALQNN